MPSSDRTFQHFDVAFICAIKQVCTGFFEGRIMELEQLRLVVKGAVRLALVEGKGDLHGDLSVAVPLLTKALEEENPLHLRDLLIQIAKEDGKQ